MTEIIPTIVQISVALLGCDGQMISPYGIDDEEDILRVSNSEVNGSYIKSTGSLELIYKKDIENMDILIFKNGMICEKDQKQNVLKGDTEVYQLSDYGTGVYTVCTGQQGNMEIVGTIICK